MLGQLTVYIKGIRDDFITRTQNSYSGNKDGSGPPKGRNMPEIVNNIVWVRQLDSKVWFQTITVNIIFLTFTMTCTFLVPGIALLHNKFIGPFIQGKIRRVLHKMRTFHINSTFRLK